MNLTNFTIPNEQHGLIGDEIYRSTQYILSQIRSYYYNKLLLLLFIGIILYFVIDREIPIKRWLRKRYPEGMRINLIIIKKDWNVDRIYNFIIQMITASMLVIIIGLLFIKIGKV